MIYRKKKSRLCKKEFNERKLKLYQERTIKRKYLLKRENKKIISIELSGSNSIQIKPLFFF